MALSLVSGPSVAPITLEECKAHLKVDDTTDDALIDALIAVVLQYLDGQDGILGRGLVTQTWDYTIDRFPPDIIWYNDFGYWSQEPIMLPLRPVQSISSISYVDSDGATQTYSASNYSLSADTNSMPRVDLGYSLTWPTTRQQRDAVTVRFIVGYGDVGSDVPEPIRQAMLLMIGHLYENRQTVSVGAMTEIPFTANALLAPYRTFV